MVLFPEEFRISGSLKQRLRRVQQRGLWEFTVDQAFESVMRACAEPRPDQDGTWITEDILMAYVGLHRQGIAHSVEVWAMPTRTLIAGLYGVSIGRIFFGESMFTRASDASKAALAVLVQQLQAWEFALIDCQQQTAHLASMGARPIARDHFLHILVQASRLPEPDWSSTNLNPSLP
jgi:leucyl/phenylalanyl-tRNA--protein transferase